MSGDHLLLIGNQGVGKNKIVDRLLQLMELEREYVQLHRDTTVQSLTLKPSLEKGVIVWEDSPLVKSVREGRILVIDEADKAPLEVVSVLKNLLEDRQMVLSDGRRITDRSRMTLLQDPNNDSESSKLWQSMTQRKVSAVSNVSMEDDVYVAYIPIHPNFRAIFLANRPGYPFLGNDFYSVMGDVLSTCIVDAPDASSERAMVASYAPNLKLEVIERLVSAFADLRALVDRDQLAYPYSTRELVAVAKHLNEFPNDGIGRALQNVIDFDHMDPDIIQMLSDTFNRHGIPVSLAQAQSNIGR